MSDSIKKKSRISEDDTLIGAQAKILREKNNISREKMAHSIGMSYQQIQKNEVGINRFSAAKLFEYSMILDEPITEFYVKLAEKYKATKLLAVPQKID